jgi:protoheme IX farnesyltransferase
MILFKVRVVVLLLFAALGGSLLAAGGWPGWGNMFLLLVTGGLCAAGASAINQYLEKDLDARMERTQDRPLVNREQLKRGQAQSTQWVIVVGGLMIALPSLAVLPFNPALTFWLLAGAFVYIGIYTLWLKRRTPLNIVIGGAAGSAAVLSGSAAAGQWNEAGALLLAVLVFVWTPTHFWSLAIAYRDDYARGGFPMLPAQIQPRAAAWWVLPHTTGAALVALSLATRPILGWFYLATIALAAAGLMVLNSRLIAVPSRTRALALFHASNMYLAIVLLVICIDTLLI